jgi:hypothetical protein
MAVSVLGKNFEIRVMEESGSLDVQGREVRCDCTRWRDSVSSRGSVDGGSDMAVVAGSEVGESDGDWSEEGQVLLGVGGHEARQGRVESSRKKLDQVVIVSESEPNLLGNSLEKGNIGVNCVLPLVLAASESMLVDGDHTKKVSGMLENVVENTPILHQVNEGERRLVGPIQENLNLAIGPPTHRPMVLKTKTRDIPFIVPTQIFTEEVASDGGVSSNDDSESQMV